MIRVGKEKVVAAFWRIEVADAWNSLIKLTGVWCWAILCEIENLSKNLGAISMRQRLCQLSRQPPFLGILDPWSNFFGQNILSYKLSHLASILRALGENVVTSMIVYRFFERHPSWESLKIILTCYPRYSGRKSWYNIMALKLPSVWLSVARSSEVALLFEMTLPQQLSQTPPPFWGLGEYRGSDDSVCLAVLPLLSRGCYLYCICICIC